MFSKFRNFLSRHKRKFIVTGVVAGGSILLWRFAKRKFIEFQEEQTRQIFEKTRRLQHFESTERACNQTIKSMAQSLCESILAGVNTEIVLEQLRNNPEKKLELWEELKVLSFTRVTALVYGISMLVITLRVQLNLLGGYLYKDTTLPEKVVTQELQAQYLSLVEHLLKDGMANLIEIIEKNIRKTLGKYNLKKPLTISDTEQLLWTIQATVNSDIEAHRGIVQFVMPKTISADNEVLTKMFAETLDLLESEEVTEIFFNSISNGLSTVTDEISDFYLPNDHVRHELMGKLRGPNGMKTEGASIKEIVELAGSRSEGPSTSVKPGPDAGFNNINRISMPLAKIIPIVNGLASKSCLNGTAGKQSLATSLVTLYTISEKMKILGVNIYEVFCN
jgi:peroxin-3